MFVELLMKKNGKIIFGLFIILCIAVTIVGGVYVYNAMNTDVFQFTKDGYALTFNSENNTKAVAYSFKSGSDYQYKKNSNTINFDYENEKVRLDENTIMHYSDGSLGVWKKVVGIDLNTIDKDIIFYYNIYKDTKVNSTSEGYSIKLATGDEISFKNLLVRVSDTKFILAGKNVRLVLNKDNLIDFGTYIEFEYMDGNVVKVYNQDKYYQTISSEAALIVDDVKINLSEGVIYKDNKQYISLTNLVVDNNGNVDTLEEKIEKEYISLEEGDIEIPTIEVPDTSVVEGNGNKDEGESGSLGDEDQKEEVEDPNKIKKTPSYKVTDLSVTALYLNATIEIIDTDDLLTSATTVQIVENKSGKIIAEETGTFGDAQAYIRDVYVTPDTEYTIYAKASYRIDEKDIERIFLSKIVRTKDLGISLEKSMVTTNSISVDVVKENYSKVHEVKVSIYNENDSTPIKTKTVELTASNVENVVFDELDSNYTYKVSMTHIKSQSIEMPESYTIDSNITTLKEKPEIGEIISHVDVRNSEFEFQLMSVKDPDYGIVNYRYEIHSNASASEGLMNSTPSKIVNTDKLEVVEVKVGDGFGLSRNTDYTCLLIVEFFDNEKIIEYSKELGRSVKLDGIIFPTLRVENSAETLTWEQYTSELLVVDPDQTITSNMFILNCRSENDSYSITVLPAERISDDTYKIPFQFKGLHKEEMHTVEVMGMVDMGDGGVETYIGSVNALTKSPQSIAVKLEPQQNPNASFSYKLTLESPPGIDSSYEASTLSSMLIKIYKGQAGTDNEPYRTYILKDSNEDSYTSTIQERLFSSPEIVTEDGVTIPAKEAEGIIIDPELFRTTNNDYLLDTTLTIVVDTARDYTTHEENIIPLVNNSVTFTRQATIPPIPEEPNNAVIIEEIENISANDYEDNGVTVLQKPELGAYTTIGYKLTPLFNNEANTGKTVHWKVYIMNKDGTYSHMKNIERDTNFPGDGKVPGTIFMLEPGTPDQESDAEDKVLRRGNTYYFEYTITLEEKITGEDGQAEVKTSTYPECVEKGVILRSADIETVKQAAVIKSYPSILEGTNYTWKYKIYDIDHSLIRNDDNKVTLEMVGADSLATVVPTTETTAYLSDHSLKDIPFTDVTFAGVTRGNTISIFTEERRNKNTVIENREILKNQYLDDEKTIEELEYTVEALEHQLRISFAENDKNAEILNYIATMDIVITADGERKTFSNKKIIGNAITIDYLGIADFKGKDMQVDLQAYYDTGDAGFDMGGLRALQKIPSSGGDTPGYFRTSSANLVLSSSLVNAAFNQITLNLNTSENYSVTVTPIDGSTQDYTGIALAEDGITYNDTYVIPKKLGIATMSNGQTVRFDTLIPGVSLSVSGALDSATINATIMDYINVIKKDEGIIIELYNRGVSETTPEQTYTFNLSDFNSPVNITGLTQNTSYGIKIYALIYNSSGGYDQQSLYDVNSYETNVMYKFVTIESVSFSAFSYQFITESYTNKFLSINFNPSIIQGYDAIEYVLKNSKDERVANGTLTGLKLTMNLTLTASPSSSQNIVFGETYSLTLIPCNRKTGQRFKETVYKNIKIPKAADVGINLQATKTDNSITFTSMITDLNHIAVDGKFSYKLVDSNGNEVEGASATDVAINYVSGNKITFSSNLVKGEKYTYIVEVKTNPKNKGEDQYEIISENITIEFGESFMLGTLATKMGNSKWEIQIIFENSYKLAETVATVQYTISNFEIPFNYSATKTFSVTPGSGYAIYNIEIPNEGTLRTNFKTNYMYTININFYSASGSMLGQREVTYYYQA